VRLAALSTVRLDPAQAGLGQADDGADLAHLIDRLSARFGAQRVLRLEARNTHIPEYAAAEMAAQHAARHEMRGASENEDDKTDSLIPARPLRLFEHPEPVEAIAEVPDGPPARFRWRHVLHEIAYAEGPERIAMQWWRDASGAMLTRDYFRVQSRSGLRAWLYREGLYGREVERPRWYVHGLFA
jgi:protein ImuB